MDVEALRALFPALADGVARFDGPGGSLTPTPVARAVAEAMTAGLCQRGTVTAAQRATDATVVQARRAIGDLLGTDPTGVVFGRSMTALTFDLARTLSAGWAPGDEVVVTRLDHDANVRPWVLAADRVGATVRWLGFDPETGEADDVGPLLTERTRLVAVTGASNLIGTRPDVRSVAEAAHAVGALVHLDAVHLAPHALVDRVGLGVDVVTCSPYKFFGPHLGALAADPAFLETLRPDKVAPSTDAVPERFELGTLPYELLAGVSAAVDVIASIADDDGPIEGPIEGPHDPPRRQRLAASYDATGAHEHGLLTRLLDGLASLAHVRVTPRAAHTTPTVLLQVEDASPSEVTARLAERDVYAPAGTFYAQETAHHLGLGDVGGVRVGLAPYTSSEDVDRLVDALDRLG